MPVAPQTPTSRGKLQSSWAKSACHSSTSDGEEKEEEEAAGFTFCVVFVPSGFLSSLHLVNETYQEMRNLELK